MKTQIFTSTNEIDLQIKIHEWLMQNPDVKRKFISEAFIEEEITIVIWYE